MGYTVHQMFVDLMSETVFSLFFVICCFSACLVNRCMAICRFCEQFLCFADSVCHFTLNHRFSCETIHWNLCVCCNNNALCLCNLCFCEHILGTAGASRLNFDPVSKLFCLFLKCFCRHISMCDTGWAAGNCEDQFSIGNWCFCFLFLFFFLFLSVFFFFCCVDHVQKFIDRFGIAQVCCEILIHQ